MSWAGLVLPLGLSVSHGAAALAATLHEAPDHAVGGHEHVHEDDAQAAGAHAHHAGDHFHETAHVPSKGVFPPDATVAGWSAQPPVTLPWPAPHRLERPPAG